MKHYVRYYVCNVYDSATTSAISLTLSALRRIPNHMRPQKKDFSAGKGIGVSKIEPALLDRRLYFSFPLSGNFERGVLLDKMRYTDNTVISYYYKERYRPLPQNTR